MVIFGLVVISAYVIPSFINHEWSATLFILKLLITTFIICILNHFLGKLPIELSLVQHLIRLGNVLCVVYLFGWFWNWYSPSYFWIILVMVVPVYAVYYLIETVKVEKDVELINKKIQSKRTRNQGEEI